MNYQRSLFVYDQDIYIYKYLRSTIYDAVEDGLLRNPRFIAGKIIGFQWGMLQQAM